jgi:hypothetical protein
MNKEFLENIIKKQLKESLASLDALETKNNSESSCLTLLSSNMKSIESNFY